METFNPADRASLLSDAFSLAESGHLGYDIPISMSSYLKKEQSLVPWETAYRSLKKIETLLDGSNAYPLLRKVNISFLSNIYHYEVYKTFSLYIKISRRAFFHFSVLS